MDKGRTGAVIMAAAIVLIAGALFFVSGAPGPVGTMLAQVGVAVGVAPNPYNTLNEQLDARQTQLDMESADLAAQKAALASDTASGTASAPSSATWYLVIAVGVLAFLVGLNFYLDWRRGRKEEEKEGAGPDEPPSTRDTIIE